MVNNTDYLPHFFTGKKFLKFLLLHHLTTRILNKMSITHVVMISWNLLILSIFHPKDEEYLLLLVIFQKQFSPHCVKASLRIFHPGRITVKKSFHEKKVLFTPTESGSKSEKDQRISDKHERKCSLSRPFLLSVNGSSIGTKRLILMTHRKRAMISTQCRLSQRCHKKS